MSLHLDEEERYNPLGERPEIPAVEVGEVDSSVPNTPTSIEGLGARPASKLTRPPEDRAPKVEFTGLGERPNDPEGLFSIVGDVFETLSENTSWGSAAKAAYDLGSSVLDGTMSNDKYADIMNSNYQRIAGQRDVVVDTVEQVTGSELSNFREFARAADAGAQHPSLIQNTVRYLTTPQIELERKKAEKDNLIKERDYYNSGASAIRGQREEMLALFDGGQIDEGAYYEARDALQKEEDTLLNKERKAREKAEEFKLGTLTKLWDENPMQLLGSVYGGMIADPVMLAVPGGQIKSAAKAGSILIKMGTTSKNLVATGRIVGGTAGAGALGGGLGAAMAAAKGLAEGGELEIDKIKDEAVIGTVFGASIGFLGSAVSAVTKYSDMPVNSTGDLEAMLRVKELEINAQITSRIQGGVDMKYTSTSEAAAAVELVTPFKRNIYVTAMGETIETQLDVMATHKNLVETMGPKIEAEQAKILSSNETHASTQELARVTTQLKTFQKTRNKLSATVRRLKGGKEGVVQEKNLKKLAAAEGNLKRHDEKIGEPLKVKRAELTNSLSDSTVAKVAKQRILNDIGEEPKIEKTIMVEGVEARLLNDKFSLSQQGIEPRVPRYHGERSFEADTQAWNSIVNKALGGEAPAPKFTKVEPTPLETPKGKPRDLLTPAARVKLAANIVAGKAPNVFKIWEDYSPTLAKLRTGLVMDANASRIGMDRSFSVESQYQIGVKLHKLREISSELEAVVGEIDDATNLELSKVVRGVADSKDVAIQKAGLAIREHMKGMATYARDAGIKVNNKADGNEPAFFPHNFNETLKGNGVDFTPEQQSFIDLIVTSDSRGRTDAQAKTALSKITKGFDSEAGALTTARKAFNTDSFNGRSLEVSDELLMPFLDNTDIIGQAKKYTMTAVHKSEMARTFQGESVGPITKKIEEELIENGIEVSPVLRQNISDIYNAMNGQYGTLDSKLTETAVNGVVMVQTLSKLATTAIISVGEGFTAVGRTGALSTAGAVVDTTGIALMRGMNKLGANLKLPKSFREADAAGLIDDMSMISAIDKAMGGETLGNMGNQAIHKFFQITGLRLVTEYSRILGYNAGRREILKQVKRIADNPEDAQAARFLAEVDITPQEANLWVTAGTNQGDEFFGKVVKGSQQLVNDIIMHPDATKRPLWQSSQGLLKPVAHLKSFMTNYFNTVGARVLSDMHTGSVGEITSKAAKNALMAVGTAGSMYYSQLLVDKVRGTERRYDNDDMDVMIRAAVKTMPIGPTNYLIDAEASSDYNTNMLVGFMGPSVGMGFDFFESVNAYRSDKNPDAFRDFAAKQLPFVNVNADVREKFVELVGGGMLTHASNYEQTVYVPTKKIRKFDKVDTTDSKFLKALKQSYKATDKTPAQVVYDNNTLDVFVEGIKEGRTQLMPTIQAEEVETVVKEFTQQGIIEPKAIMNELMLADEDSSEADVTFTGATASSLKDRGITREQIESYRGTRGVRDDVIDGLLESFKEPKKKTAPAPKPKRSILDLKSTVQGGKDSIKPLAPIAAPRPRIEPTYLQRSRANTDIISEEGLKGLIGQPTYKF